MSGQLKIAFSAALALMALTALLLARVQSFQTLGRPGVKMAARPVFGENGEVVGTNTIDLPERVLNYESKALPIHQVVLDWLPKDTTYAQRAYQAADGFNLTVNVVLMGTDRTSIHKPEYCLTGQGLRIEKTEHLTISVPGAHPYTLPVARMTSSFEHKDPSGNRALQRVLFVYWFVADGQLTSRHNQRFWWMARDMIARGRLQRWAYVSCLAVCVPGQEDAVYARMQEFIAAAVPQFQLTEGKPAALARRD